jgi:hypothetical protein
MWFGKKDRKGLVAYREQLVRQHALRRLADVFQVTEASLSGTDRFGEELRAAPATDFRFNEFDTLDEDIKWVADKRLLREMATGKLVIRTVADYCDHMVHCSRLNIERVAEVLKLPVAAGEDFSPAS